MVVPVAAVTWSLVRAFCTLSPVSEFREPREVSFVGTATADTIAAGPGRLTPSAQRGHQGRGGPRAIYGQVVAVERLGAPWRALLPSGTRRVLLVPWDYGADCNAVYWTQSTVWAPPGTRGLYSGTLREPGEWAAGMPTFDVTPAVSLYPEGSAYHGPLGAPASARLTADEALGLREVLPLRADFDRAPDSAMTPFRAWLRSNPALVDRWPVPQIMGYYRYIEENLWLRRQPTPLTGTYRLRVTLPTGDTLTAFARTNEGPMGDLRHRTREDLRRDMLARGRSPIVGYHLMVMYRLDDDGFPARYRGVDDDVTAYISALFDASDRGPDSAVYHGAFEVMRPLSRLYPTSSVLRQLQRASSSDTVSSFVPGRFTVGRDGSVRFDWEARRNGELLFQATAERISAETFRYFFPRGAP